MPPIIALALGTDSPPLKPLEQVLRDRHDHVFVLHDDEALSQVLEARPQAVVFMSPGAHALAFAIRERLGATGPRLIAVFPEPMEEPDAYDEHLAAKLCSRVLVQLIERGDLGFFRAEVTTQRFVNRNCGL